LFAIGRFSFLMLRGVGVQAAFAMMRQPFYREDLLLGSLVIE
jgi:hypothetical protein